VKGRLFVFFPVYNEGASAAALVTRVDAECRRLGRPYRILLVDDGSTDGSFDLIRGLDGGIPMTILVHETNQGLRAALETGLRWLTRECEPDDVVVTMDGDDTHDPVRIPEMLALVDEGADVVVASRFRRGAVIEGVPRHRQVLSLGANLFGWLGFHIPGVRDYACGYRAVRGRTLKDVVDAYGEDLFELRRHGFVCSLELLVKLAEKAGRCAEVPITLRYDRKEGASKMDAARTVLGHLVLFAHRLKRARPARG
jgi:dolichol-phosphate mannosyltransferase